MLSSKPCQKSVLACAFEAVVLLVCLTGSYVTQQQLSGTMYTIEISSMYVYAIKWQPEKQEMQFSYIPVCNRTELRIQPTHPPTQLLCFLHTVHQLGLQTEYIWELLHVWVHGKVLMPLSLSAQAMALHLLWEQCNAGSGHYGHLKHSMHMPSKDARH